MSRTSVTESRSPLALVNFRESAPAAFVPVSLPTTVTVGAAGRAVSCTDPLDASTQSPVMPEMRLVLKVCRVAASPSLSTARIWKSVNLAPLVRVRSVPVVKTTRSVPAPPFMVPVSAAPIPSATTITSDPAPPKKLSAGLAPMVAKTPVAVRPEAFTTPTLAGSAFPRMTLGWMPRPMVKPRSLLTVPLMVIDAPLAKPVKDRNSVGVDRLSTRLLAPPPRLTPSIKFPAEPRELIVTVVGTEVMVMGADELMVPPVTFKVAAAESDAYPNDRGPPGPLSGAVRPTTAPVGRLVKLTVLLDL